MSADENNEQDVTEAELISSPIDDVLEATVIQEAEVVDSEPQDAIDATPSKPRKGRKKSDSISVASKDPLALYMKDAQRYPLLSREEEHALALRYVNDNDLDAARQLVTANLRLVVKIAYDYRQAYKNILDLVQEGNIGLMQAVKKYDPYKGVKLSSYAAWWIRAYMLRFILNNHRLVKLGTTQAQRKLFFNLKKEKAKLAAMGIDATPQLIAERLDVSEKDVISMDRRMSSGEASLDAPVGGADGRTVARVELLSSSEGAIDDQIAKAELGDKFSKKIHEFGTHLEGKEAAIFKQRLLSEEPRTLQQLGDEFKVSRERIRQIEKRLLQKLRSYLSAELGDSVIDAYEA